MNYKTKTVRHQQQYQKWKGLYTKPSSHSTSSHPLLQLQWRVVELHHEYCQSVSLPEAWDTIHIYLAEQCCRVRPSDRKYGFSMLVAGKELPENHHLKD